ncbi:ribonuclease HI [Candidatus Saccharibacteria bacterium]|nr:ribonuclease HI [Candidatus Saccharibacteria bacterium]MCL1963176.1 ribonuclease HI [Candidatus Saccharibacteria bacterium]
MIIYFTDGSASPNPGPGGFAVIRDGKPRVIGGEPEGSMMPQNATTNIRMEGLAIMAALNDADGTVCEIRSDSEFWINVLTKWAPGWAANGWKKKSKGEIQNLDIVRPLFELYQKSNAKLVWVRGHVGTELNELADEWANKARKLKLTNPKFVKSS